MKTIGKILTGIALTTMLAGPVMTQEKTPVKLSTETGTRFNEKENGVYFQRFRLENDIANVCYDIKTNLKDKSKTENDMFEVYRNFSLSDKTTLGAAYFRLGDWNNSDDHDLDVYVKTKDGDNTYFFDTGIAVRETGKPWNYVYGTFTGKNVNLEAATLGVDHTLFNEGRNKLFALASAWTNDNFYAAAGTNDRDLRFFAGKFTENEGTFGFAQINRDGSWWVKSQSAFGSINKGFYNIGNFNWASSYLTVPKFEFTKLGSGVTKGDGLTLKIEGQGDETYTSVEMMPGHKLGDFGSLGVGPNVRWTNDVPKAGIAVDYYKSFSIFGDQLKGSIEGRYVSTTNDAGVYLKLFGEM